MEMFRRNVKSDLSKTIGCKPPLELLKAANLYGKLNGGEATKSCSGYFRFKSIVNRLKIRQCDGALVFKGNGKVVIPHSRFACTIIEAHISSGHKHLNLSATIAKLSEKYTMGCRQFGICEETVRAVIKSCREGTCADKLINRTGVSIMKNLVKSAKRSKSMKDQPSITRSHKDEAVSSPPQHTMNEEEQEQPNKSTTQSSDQEPAYAVLEKLPNGNFIIKQFVMKPASQNTDKSTGMSSASMPSPSTNDNLVIGPKGSVPIPGNSVIIMTNQPCPSTNMMRFYGPGSNSLVPFQVGNNSTRFAIPVNFIFTNPSAPSMTDLLTQSQAIGLFPQSVYPPFNNRTGTVNGELFEKRSPSVDDNNNIDMVDRQTGCTDSGHVKAEVCKNRKSTLEECQSMDVRSMDMPANRTQMPFPFLWYKLRDIERETDPYVQINLAIKDMRLDVQKSLRGDNQAMEALKTKIDVLTQMVRVQKQKTEKYKDDLLRY